MLTENEKIVPERQVRLTELTRATAGKFEQNSKPIEFTTQNGQIMRKRNEPKMAYFPKIPIFSTGILEYWKVS